MSSLNVDIFTIFLLTQETRARFSKKFQHRVDLQRLRDRLGTHVPDVVAPEPELGQDPIEHAF